MPTREELIAERDRRRALAAGAQQVPASGISLDDLRAEKARREAQPKITPLAGAGEWNLSKFEALPRQAPTAAQINAPNPIVTAQRASQTEAMDAFANRDEIAARAESDRINRLKDAYRQKYGPNVKFSGPGFTPDPTDRAEDPLALRGTISAINSTTGMADAVLEGGDAMFGSGAPFDYAGNQLEFANTKPKPPEAKVAFGDRGYGDKTGAPVQEQPTRYTPKLNLSPASTPGEMVADFTGPLLPYAIIPGKAIDTTFKIAGGIAKSSPFIGKALAAITPQGSSLVDKGIRYGGRLLGTMPENAAHAAAFGAMMGEDGQRLETAVQFASDPINYLAQPVASLLQRAGIAIKTMGARVTPEAIQLEQAVQTLQRGNATPEQMRAAAETINRIAPPSPSAAPYPRPEGSPPEFDTAVPPTAPRPQPAQAAAQGPAAAPVKPFSASPVPAKTGNIVARNADRIVGGAIGATLGGAGDAFAAPADGEGDNGIPGGGAGIGAAMGIFGPRVLAQAGSRGFRFAARPFRPLGFDERVAARAVRQALKSGGITSADEARAAMTARFGDKPATIADLSQEGVGTAAGLSRLPGSTGEVSRARGEDLLEGRAGRLERDIGDATGASPATIAGDVDRMVALARQQAKPAYDALRQQYGVGSIQSPRLDQLRELDILAPHIRGVERYRETLAATEGRAVGDFEYWDLVKRSLDDAEQSAVARSQPVPYDLDSARQAIVEEMDRLVPGYADARVLGGEAPKMQSAFKQGQSLLGGRYTAEDVGRLIEGVTGQPMTAMQAGVIRSMVAKTEGGRSAMTALMSPGARQKLAKVFGQEASDAMQARFAADAAIVNNAHRMNPNVGSVTSQAIQGGGLGPVVAGAIRAFRSPAEAALAALSKSGGYSKAQRDIMGEMLLGGATDDNLERIFRGRVAPRGNSASTAPPAPRRPLPGETSSASPTVTGALVGGGLGYAASDGDPRATLAVAVGGGVLGRAAGKFGSGRKAPRPVEKPNALGNAGRSVPPGGAREPITPQQAFPAEKIDTTGWGQAEFQAARTQLNEMMQDVRKASPAERPAMEAEIASLKQALGLGDIPAEYRDVSMASRFKPAVDQPWAAGSAEDKAIKQAIEKKQWTVEAVPAEQITPTQESVFYDYAKAAQRYSGDETMPVLVKQGDQYFVADGHHRLMATKGSGPIRARVIELPSSPGASGRNAASSPRMDSSQGWYHSGDFADFDKSKGQLGLHVGTQRAAASVGNKAAPHKLSVKGDFARTPDMDQWTPADYTESRAYEQKLPADERWFDDRFPDLWAELDAFAATRPTQAAWHQRVREATLKRNLAGWEYSNTAEHINSLSRIVMDERAVGPSPGAPKPVKNGLGSSSLPVDEASRMQRAREQGFDTETVYYHGTMKDVDHFDPEKFGANDYGWHGKGVYLATNPEWANTYSGMGKGFFEEGARWRDKTVEHWNNLGKQPNVMPVYVRGKVAKTTNTSARIEDYPDADALLVDYGNGHTEMVVRDPSNIRGKFAKFDPAESSSSKLLADMSGADKATLASAGGGIAYGELGPLQDMDGDGDKDEQDRQAMRVAYGMGGIMTPLIVRGAHGMGKAAFGKGGKPRPVSGGINQGTFGGAVGAKNLAAKGELRPQQALAMAEKMAAQGASRDEIWDATAKHLEGTPYAGVYKGVDGKWRFEIDDSRSTFNDAAMKPKTYRIFDQEIDARTGKTGEVLEHPDVYAAYPQLADVEMVQGRFRDGTLGTYSGSFANNTLKPSIALNLDDMPTNAARRSTALHEVDHGVQDIEDFARGGSAKSAESLPNPALTAYENAIRTNPVMQEFNRLRNSSEYYAELDANNKMWRQEFQGRLDAIEEAAKGSRESWRAAKPQMDEIFAAATAEARKRFPTMARVDDLNAQLREAGIPTLKPAETLSGYEAYRRLAGEVEARNVQTRDAMRLRGEKPGRPWETQDVPDDQQIVRFGGGKAESRPKPSQKGFGSGRKGPPGVKRVVMEKRIGNRLGKMAPALKPETREAIRANAALPPAMRKSAYEASGRDPALIEIASPFMTGANAGGARKAPGLKFRKLPRLDNDIAKARAEAARAPQSPPLESAAEMRYRTENARRGAKGAVTRWENDNYDFAREAAGKPQIKAPIDKRKRMERSAEDAALADRVLKQMNPTADDVEWLQRKATRRLAEIDDAIKRGQVSPEFMNGKPRTRAEAEDMARLIFDAEYADLLDEVLSGKVVPKPRSEHALAVFLAASAAGSAIGVPLAIAEIRGSIDRDRAARESAEKAKGEDMTKYAEPGDPRFVWDWQKIKSRRGAVQTIQANLNALPPNKSDGRFNLSIDAWGPKTEAAVKRWQFENGFKPTGELTQDQWSLLDQQATAARQKAPTR